MRTWLVGIALSMSVLGCAVPDDHVPRSTDGACLRSGCSHEVCSDQDVITPCLWRAEYACYRDAICERQDDGACGWSATPELKACLASP